MEGQTIKEHFESLAPAADKRRKRGWVLLRVLQKPLWKKVFYYSVKERRETIRRFIEQYEHEGYPMYVQIHPLRPFKNMTPFQKSLDRYLTTEPPDDYTPWVEAVVEECISIDPKWDIKGEFLDSATGDNILWYLNRKHYTPAAAAALLVKTFPQYGEQM